jgi:hypothetical protein
MLQLDAESSVSVLMPVQISSMTTKTSTPLPVADSSSSMMVSDTEISLIPDVVRSLAKTTPCPALAEAAP